MKKLRILFILICWGCSHPQQKIDVRDYISQSIDWSIIDTTSIQAVRLEMNEHCIINHITKVIIYDDRIFVFDKGNGNVISFDINGKFIARIGDKGRARDEYGEAVNFTMDRNKRLIFVSDRGSMRQIVYDFDGNFVTDYKLGYMPMAIVEGDKFVFASNPKTTKENYELIKYDNESRIVGGYYEREGFVQKNEGYYMAEHYFSQVGDKYYFVPYYTDEIMSINENGDMKTEKKLGFQYQMVNYEKSETLYDKDKLWAIRDFYVTTNGNYYFDVPYGAESIITFYGNIQKDRFVAGGIINQTIPRKVIQTLNIVGSYQTKFISVFSGSSSFKDLYPDAKEEDNPYIILFDVVL